MDSVAPEVTVRISSKRKFTEPWMTQGIENSNNHCQKLYKKMLIKNCSSETVTAYKTYQNALNRLKWFAKVTTIIPNSWNIKVTPRSSGN